MSEEKKYNGFKLISLYVKGNKRLKKGELFYEFIDEADEQNEIYATVFIGANGTGKSNLFFIIIELFKQIYDIANNKERSSVISGKFILRYALNGFIYEYTNVDRDDVKNPNILLFKNGKQINFSKEDIPLNIIASSILLTDKVPFHLKKNFENYYYLGIKYNPQTASTRSFVRKIVELVVLEVNSSAFREGLKKTTEFLELNRAIDILYFTSNTHLFFSGKLHPNEFIKYFEDIRERYSHPRSISPPYKLNHYISIQDNYEQIFKICEFCNDLVLNGRLKKREGSSVKTLNYNIANEDSFQQLKNEYDTLELLRKLGILTAPEIQFNGANTYDLQESSSGEFNFFTSIVGLMASVKENSVVFIDEPEISLHPNWQMKYMSFLRKLFSDKRFSSSHILIATHSHFLISDLQSKNSKIIGLKNIEDKIQIVNIPKNINTFGWSAEEVLYAIFNVKTSRNSFLEYDLTKMITMINRNSIEYDEIKRILKKVLQIQIHEADPLKIIVEKAQKYLIDNNA